MEPAASYSGREQSYLKHFVLKKYLERLAYNVLSFADEIVYVDGFCGPWRSEDEDYCDTSFHIASHTLHEVSNSLGKKARAVFIEHDQQRFETLQQATKNSPIDSLVLHGSFEELIPQVTKIVGNSFAFYFVDPTGWKGVPLKKLGPLLTNRRAELLINFMYDYVNRFLTTETVRGSIVDFFGGPVEGIKPGADRENSILDLYRSRLREHGKDVLATSTRIRKPLENRAYFHLVYVTHHVKGLIEFKNVVERLAPEELDAWAIAKNTKDEASGQQSLFGDTPATKAPSKDYRAPAFKAMVDQTCDRLLKEALPSFETYGDILEALLQAPDVWNGDVEAATHRAIRQGIIVVPELTGQKRRLYPKYKIRRT